MRLHADASVKRPFVASLRDAGLEITSQYDVDPTMDDAGVLSVANDLDAILLTEDKDFGELVFRNGLYAKGVILVRADVVDAETVAVLTARVASALGQAKGFFTTVTKHDVRRKDIPLA
jgi:predicted nuclease of predicted toxin-antitoxin system